MAITSAEVDIVIQNNSTWIDAFQFGTVGDTSWSFTGQTFQLDVKGNKDQAAALLSLTTGAGTIVVDDAVLRVLHFLVPDSVVKAALQVGEYEYELIMIDGSTPPVRVPLMAGELHVTQGIGVG